VVLSIDGVDINDEPGARFRLATHAPGDDARFTILREGEQIALDVSVVPAPGVTDPERLIVEGSNPLAGVSLVRLSPAFNESIGLDPFKEGVMVLSVQRRSAAAYFGFRAGDRVIELQDIQIDDIDDADDVLVQYDGQKSWPVIVERQGRRYEQTLRM